jgi:uncharacterized protein YkwD
MHVCKQQFIVPVLGLTVAFLLSVFAITGASEGPPLPLDITPTAYVYLPLAARQLPPESPPEPTIPPDDLANEQSIADLINQQRKANGLAALTLVPELTQAARRHSRDMADHDFLSHTGSDGSSPGERVQEAGYDWVTVGEIIGCGFGGDPQEMVDWWMNSPSHRAIILSSSLEEFGVGYAINTNSSFGHYWTVDFGKRAA